MSVWQPLQVGSAECWAKRWRVVEFGSGSGALIITLGGGGGMLAHNSRSRTSLPRWTGEVWLECALMVSKLPSVSTPARCEASKVTREKSAPGGAATP